MKIKDITDQYGLDHDAFERFLENSSYRVRRMISGSSIDDSENISAIIEEFKIYEEDKVAPRDWQVRAQLEQLAAMKKVAAKQQAAMKKAAAEQQAAIARAAVYKKNALANMLITSGSNFDGYTIKKYSGYISGDEVITVDLGMPLFELGVNTKDELLGTLAEMRRKALTKLKEATFTLGCNAIIGVDFDYLTFNPQTANLNDATADQQHVFIVTANGNAVIIEKNY